MGGLTRFFTDDSMLRWAVDDSVARKVRQAFAHPGTGRDTIGKIKKEGGSRYVKLPPGIESIAHKVYAETVIADEAEIIEMVTKKVFQGHIMAVTFLLDEKEAKETRSAVQQSQEARRW